MEFIAKWYDHEFIVAIDPDPIIADSEDAVQECLKKGSFDSPFLMREKHSSWGKPFEKERKTAGNERSCI